MSIAGRPRLFRSSGRKKDTMKQHYITMQKLRFTAVAGIAVAVVAGTLVWQTQAADAKDAIKEVMKAYHKAPNVDLKFWPSRSRRGS